MFGDHSSSQSSRSRKPAVQPFYFDTENSSIFPQSLPSASSSRISNPLQRRISDRGSESYLDDIAEHSVEGSLPSPGPTRSSGPAVEGGPLAKRRKIRRSKQACQHCRTRKRKCGGIPPNPCPNCVEDEQECFWPMDDGRSSSSRRVKGSKSSRGGPPDQVSGGTIDTGQGGGEFLSQDDAWMSLFGDLVNGNDGQVSANNTSATETIMDTSQLDFFNLGNLDFLAAASSASDPMAFAGSGPPASGDNTFGDLTAMMPNWTSNLDPHQFVHALSSRMPTVEQSSLNDDTSPRSDFDIINILTRDGDGTGQKAEQSQKVVKVTWWRPHGQTAIAPGLKRMTLKVRLVDPSASERGQSKSPMTDSILGTNPVDLFGPDRTPSVPIMRHLLHLFGEYFGSQFPWLNLPRLQSDLEAGRGSVFLLNCIAAVSARFSTLPIIASDDLQAHEYGNVFAKVAKDMLGSMLALPSRETVVALLLLCHIGFANDSEAEEWMFAGMATRMAIDLGLHLDPGQHLDISEEDRRLNRLVFWSVVLLDFALAFGTGRQPTYRVDEITQSLPTQDDINHCQPSSTGTIHPFPYAAQQMYSYGKLIELLNSRRAFDGDQTRKLHQEVQRCRMDAMKAYGLLPDALQWNVSNLQKQAMAGQAPIYLQLHLWMHTIITSGYLTGTDYLRREQGRRHPSSDTASGAVTPNGLAAANIWRHSARTIGDILVLCDIVCPKAYLGLPFVNQAFYVAGSCYVKDLENERQKRRAAHNDGGFPPPFGEAVGETDENGSSAEIVEAILTSVATENISTLRKGLTKQTKYWSGVAWVAEALEQRIRGIGVSEIDLVIVTEKLNSFASVPDAGLLHRSEDQGVDMARSRA